MILLLLVMMHHIGIHIVFVSEIHFTFNATQHPLWSFKRESICSPSSTQQRRSGNLIFYPLPRLSVPLHHNFAMHVWTCDYLSPGSMTNYSLLLLQLCGHNELHRCRRRSFNCCRRATAVEAAAAQEVSTSALRTALLSLFPNKFIVAQTSAAPGLAEY